jgi:multicomponent Na+:H+ antiporter subunit B
MNNGSEVTKQSGMTIIVKTVTSWVKGFIFIFGLYVILFGHLSPGGGFPGGVVVASVYILLTLAFGSEISLKNLSKVVSSELDSIGALMFLGVALLGMFTTGTFFVNFIQKFRPGENFKFLSSGTIVLSNIAIGLKVGMCLFMVFIIFALTKIVIRPVGNVNHLDTENNGVNREK